MHSGTHIKRHPLNELAGETMSELKWRGGGGPRSKYKERRPRPKYTETKPRSKCMEMRPRPKHMKRRPRPKYDFA